MRIINYIDRKNTFYEVRRFVKTFILYGMPIGYVFGQIFSILIIGWEKYNFSFVTLFTTLTFNLIVFSPFIYSYFMNKKKLYKFIDKVINKSIKEVKIKALFDYKAFKKDEFYTFTILDIGNAYLTPAKWRQIKFDDEYLYVEEKKSTDIYDLKEIINKFQLDDIKEERLRKLKKLKSLW